MSKNELLAFAKGRALEKEYNVNYTIDGTGKIHIHSCVDSGGHPSVWMRIAHSKEETEFKTTKEKMNEAIAEYLKEAKLNASDPETHLHFIPIQKEGLLITFANGENEVNSDRDYLTLP